MMMVTTEIIRFPAVNPGGTYLRIFIKGKLYDRSFSDIKEMQRHFQVTAPRHLLGEPLPKVIYDAEVVETYGETNEHKLFALVDMTRLPRYFLVGGPMGSLWEKIYWEPDDASTFAKVKAEQFHLG